MRPSGLFQFEINYLQESVSFKCVLILSSHLLGLPIGRIPTAFLTRMLYTQYVSPIRVTCPIHRKTYKTENKKLTKTHIYSRLRNDRGGWEMG